MSKYIVTCLRCKEIDTHEFDDQNHRVLMSGKVLHTNILGFRWRKDNTWGFHCKCGNWNLLGKDEAKDFDLYTDGDPITVANNRESLNIPDNQQFKLERVG